MCTTYLSNIFWLGKNAFKYLCQPALSDAPQGVLRISFAEKVSDNYHMNGLGNCGAEVGIKSVVGKMQS